jgi:hypothetical protein
VSLMVTETYPLATEPSPLGDWSGIGQLA